MGSRHLKAGIGMITCLTAGLMVFNLHQSSAMLLILISAMLTFLFWQFSASLSAHICLTQLSETPAKTRLDGSRTLAKPMTFQQDANDIHDLLDNAVQHVQRNAAKARALCHSEKQNLYQLLRTLKSLHLDLAQRYQTLNRNNLIDERVNHLDYQADRMVLLIDRFSEVVLQLENIASNAKDHPPKQQLGELCALCKEINRVTELLKAQQHELGCFTKKYSYDATSQALESCGKNVDIILQTIHRDTEAFIRILGVATELNKR